MTMVVTPVTVTSFLFLSAYYNGANTSPDFLLQKITEKVVKKC